MYYKGTILRMLNRLPEAYEMFQAARKEAEAKGSRMQLLDILPALRELEEQRGNTVAAAALQNEWSNAVNYVIEHTKRPELRAAFLKKMAVQHD